MKRERMTCPRCGKDVSVVMGGNTAAHMCPHGLECSTAKWRDQPLPACPDCGLIHQARAGTPHCVALVDWYERGQALQKENDDDG